MTHAVDHSEIAFRKLGLSDLGLMHEWLNYAHVSQWYGQRPSLEAVVEKYSAKILGRDRTVPFLILYAGSPIGYIQTYRISDHPDYNKYVQADKKTVAIDLFIGERTFIHKGYGTAILIKFLEDVVFSDKSITSCLIGPEPRNRAAIKCYEKVGFRPFKTIHIPGEPEAELLMHIERDAC